jgi:hypothetical protein
MLAFDGEKSRGKSRVELLCSRDVPAAVAWYTSEVQVCGSVSGGHGGLPWNIVANGDAPRKAQMKKPAPKPTEHECPECNGTGFAPVAQPARLGVRVYPERCKECLGKGRIPN